MPEGIEMTALPWRRGGSRDGSVDPGSGRPDVVVFELGGGTFQLTDNLHAFRQWVRSVTRFSFEPEPCLPYRAWSQRKSEGSAL